MEEVQKINILTKELRKHHIAESSEDAFAQAELMVKGQAHDTSKEDEVNRELRSIGLKINSLYSDIVSLQLELKAVKEGMASLNRKLDSRIQAQPIERPAQPTSQQVPIKVTASATPEQVAEPAKKSETRLRTGDYTEKDVNVEKFFYYGKK